jgi:hypothetical protein
MKKLALVLLGLLIFTTVNSYAYTISDPIGDQIGNSVFDIYGIDIVQSANSITFDIYTNYPKTGVTVGNWHTFAGDLLFDFNGDNLYDHGVAFTGNEGLTRGGFYGITALNTSDHYALPGYSYNNGEYVTIESGALLGLVGADSKWENIAGYNPNYRWHLTLDRSFFPSNTNIGISYASATCANDYIKGSFTTTPEPTSLSLLGLGLLGLAGLKRKKAK